MAQKKLSDYSRSKVNARIQSHNSLHELGFYCQNEKTAGVTCVQFRPQLTTGGKIVGSTLGLCVPHIVMAARSLEEHFFDTDSGEHLGTTDITAAQTLTSSGLAAIRIGDFEHAALLLDRAQRLMPSNVQMRANARHSRLAADAQRHISAGRFVEGRAVYERLCSTATHTAMYPHFVTRRDAVRSAVTAASALGRGDFASAAVDFLEAGLLYPEDVYKQLRTACQAVSEARVCLTHGQPEEAQRKLASVPARGRQLSTVTVAIRQCSSAATLLSEALRHFRAGQFQEAATTVSKDTDGVAAQLSQTLRTVLTEFADSRKRLDAGDVMGAQSVRHLTSGWRQLDDETQRVVLRYNTTLTNAMHGYKHLCAGRFVEANADLARAAGDAAGPAVERFRQAAANAAEAHAAMLAGDMVKSAHSFDAALACGVVDEPVTLQLTKCHGTALEAIGAIQSLRTGQFGLAKELFARLSLNSCIPSIKTAIQQHVTATEEALHGLNAFEAGEFTESRQHFQAAMAKTTAGEMLSIFEKYYQTAIKVQDAQNLAERGEYSRAEVIFCSVYDSCPNDALQQRISLLRHKASDNAAAHFAAKAVTICEQTVPDFNAASESLRLAAIWTTTDETREFYESQAVSMERMATCLSSWNRAWSAEEVGAVAEAQRLFLEAQATLVAEESLHANTSWFVRLRTKLESKLRGNEHYNAAFPALATVNVSAVTAPVVVAILDNAIDHSTHAVRHFECGHEVDADGRFVASIEAAQQFQQTFQQLRDCHTLSTDIEQMNTTAANPLLNRTHLDNEQSDHELESLFSNCIVLQPIAGDN